MRCYVPDLNDDVLLDGEEVYLPDNKLIILLNAIYDLNKKYQIEKIVSFNDANYFEEIKEVTKNKTMELSNHYIDQKEGYFHITFVKKLDPNLLLRFDDFCPYAFSMILDGKEILRQKYLDLLVERKKKYSMK